ncbi:carboxypeptidase Q-like protein, partial [Dinothrombium tinctorium]
MKMRAIYYIFGIVFTLNLIILKFINGIEQLDCERVKYNREEVKSKSKVVNKIIDYVLENETGVTYNELAKLIDKFGPRFSGTNELEASIDYIVQQLAEKGFDVHTEDVEVKHWIRGNETAEIIFPRRQKINILGLGFSIGTNGNTLSSEVLVLRKLEEFEQRSNEILGKIVVFNYATRPSLSEVTNKVSEHGAKAVLVKSIAGFSLYIPHTGVLFYDSRVQKIPAACITMEDAELIDSMSQRGKLIIAISTTSRMDPMPKISRIIIVNHKGNQNPNEMVIISGHIDSWDVGQGAMDNGGGSFVTLRGLKILKKLGIKMKRILRVVLFIAEEIGLVGAKNYAERHKDEKKNIYVAMESDFDTFRPLGLVVTSKQPKTKCIMKEALKLFESINATEYTEKRLGSTDVDVFIPYNISIIELRNANEIYFYYHHSSADTMAIEDLRSLTSVLL